MEDNNLLAYVINVVDRSSHDVDPKLVEEIRYNMALFIRDTTNQVARNALTFALSQYPRDRLAEINAEAQKLAGIASQAIDQQQSAEIGALIADVKL